MVLILVCYVFVTRGDGLGLFGIFVVLLVLFRNCVKIGCDELVVFFVSLLWFNY